MGLIRLLFSVVFCMFETLDNDKKCYIEVSISTIYLHFSLSLPVTHCDLLFGATNNSISD